MQQNLTGNVGSRSLIQFKLEIQSVRFSKHKVYHGGPLVPPYSGWLEPSTIRDLVARWSEEPLIARVVWWYYPLNDLKKYDQPSLAEQLQWWRTVDAWAECPPIRTV